MSTPFTFGFNDDDIDDYEALETPSFKEESSHDTKLKRVSLRSPCLHAFEDMLATLPSAISYGSDRTLCVDGSTAAPLAPRRELFDIRTQLMAEEDDSESDSALVASDLQPGVYEGGFKTWECSIDLARYLQKILSEGSLDIESQNIHVIELGAGTAVPACTLLSRILLARSPQSSSGNTTGPVFPSTQITVADYNESVLQLATVPNIILSALSSTHLSSSLKATPTFHPSGDLDTTTPEVQTLPHALAQFNIHIRGISGAWGSDFATLAQAGPTPTGTNIHGDGVTLVLASETIYSPDTLPAFVHTLRTLLIQHVTENPEGNRRSGKAVALVAAKKMYFGVGGGVEEFSRAAIEAGLRVVKVWDSEEGVGRCILQVVAG